MLLGLQIHPILFKQITPKSPALKSAPLHESLKKQKSQ